MTVDMWWEKPLRIVQTNLQVKDTDKIKPKRLAEQLKDLGANTVVFNVGGIYAWYKSEVSFHNVNPFLPEDFDLLAQVIEAFHERGLKFVARFDFSKAEDYVYLNRPEWFVRDKEGNPKIIGEERPGDWSLLMSTCINSGYRNDELAIPVLEEVMDNYQIDGIFYNAPSFIPCHCDECKRRYRKLYGAELPDKEENFHPDWSAHCLRENIENLYSFIKKKDENLPMILYYGLGGEISSRAEVTDLLCTEPQDVLSLGHNNIPEFWKPALSIKVGRQLKDKPRPLGIVHSCPGMDWRHTGLPPSEYAFWLSQIPANGGQIWHSLTGIPDTIKDKRILDTVTKINGKIKKVEGLINGAESLAQVCLLWEPGESARGLAEGMLNRQIPFDVLTPDQASVGSMQQFDAVVIPQEWSYRGDFLSNLAEYVRGGGRILVEGPVPSERESLSGLLGIKPETYLSEYLTASYLKFEDERGRLGKGMEDTELIPYRGVVEYSKPLKDTEVLATLVPPFSPLESVGAPPERASLPVSDTDIPLALLNSYERGGALFLPFSLGGLIEEFKLNEHSLLLKNAVDILLGEGKFLQVSHYDGLQVTVFKKSDRIILNLVNGTGRRPLSETVPLFEILIGINLGLFQGRRVKKARELFGGEELQVDRGEDMLEITLPELEVWKALSIDF